MSDEQLREFRREKMSMVFQKFALLPHRTIIDNVSYGLKDQRLACRRTARASTKVD